MASLSEPWGCNFLPACSCCSSRVVFLKKKGRAVGVSVRHISEVPPQHTASAANAVRFSNRGRDIIFYDSYRLSLALFASSLITPVKNMKRLYYNLLYVLNKARIHGCR
jgi:hypothetical protein